jgi:hypothetical protein
MDAIYHFHHVFPRFLHGHVKTGHRVIYGKFNEYTVRSFRNHTGIQHFGSPSRILITALQARGVAFADNATDEQLRELLARPPAEGARSHQPAVPVPTLPAPPAAPTDARARTSITDILDLADAHARSIPTAHALAREAIRQGHDVMQFQRTLLDALNKGYSDAATKIRETATIGLGDRDADKFSVRKFLLAIPEGTGLATLILAPEHAPAPSTLHAALLNDDDQ